MRIDRLVKKNIRGLKPYQAKEIQCRVKLDANESPYGFDKALDTLGKIETNRYPDPEARELRRLLAKSWGVGINNILHGNGSDELIYYLINTFGGPVLYPSPTFSMYGIIAGILDEKDISVSLGKNFELPVDRILKVIKEKKPRIVFLSSPNNPTGNSFESDAMIKLLKVSRGIVVIDEAYQQFSSGKSFIGLIKMFPNLVVMRTLSKIGLASLRSGFIISGKDVISQVNKTRLPFNVNSLSQAVAIKALKNNNALDRIIRTVIRERDALFEKLKELGDVKPYPSDANFILFRVSNADRVYAGLLKQGVLIRNLSNIIKGCLRVTIGTQQENKAFVSALKKII
ncbi:MAG: histidinol-phosphate transaminase [Thermodesulfovibrionales bacterium]